MQNLYGPKHAYDLPTGARGLAPVGEIFAIAGDKLRMRAWIDVANDGDKEGVAGVELQLWRDMFAGSQLVVGGGAGVSHHFDGGFSVSTVSAQDKTVVVPGHGAREGDPFVVGGGAGMQFLIDAQRIWDSQKGILPLPWTRWRVRANLRDLTKPDRPILTAAWFNDPFFLTLTTTPVPTAVLRALNDFALDIALVDKDGNVVADGGGSSGE